MGRDCLCARPRPALAVGSAMPRDGSVTLSDLEAPSLYDEALASGFRPHRQADRHPTAPASPWAAVGRGVASAGCLSSKRASGSIRAGKRGRRRARPVQWHRSMLTPSSGGRLIGAAFLPFEAGEP